MQQYLLVLVPTFPCTSCTCVCGISILHKWPFSRAGWDCPRAQSCLGHPPLVQFIWVVGLHGREALILLGFGPQGLPLWYFHLGKCLEVWLLSCSDSSVLKTKHTRYYFFPWYGLSEILYMQPLFVDTF